MQKIPLKYAAPGMVLAKPVTTDDGKVLIGKGSTLSEGIISKLKQRDISVVTVEGHLIEIPGEERKSCEDLIKELEERFSKVEGSALMDDIKDLFKRHIKHLIEEEAL